MRTVSPSTGKKYRRSGKTLREETTVVTVYTGRGMAEEAEAVVYIV